MPAVMWQDIPAETFARYVRLRAAHSLTLEDAMGMYDRDPNFEDDFKVGDRMILMNMEYVGPVNTVHGQAQKTLITVVTRETYARETGRQVTYSALGNGFAAMAQRASAGDFPHVAEYVKVPTGQGTNRVKRFAPVDIDVSSWVKGDDGPPIPAFDTPDAPTTAPAGDRLDF